MTTLENITGWNELHTKRRHALNYPAEPVVRFIQYAKQTTNAAMFLDVGCGAGRHMKLAAELGLDGFGVDASEEAIRQAKRHGDAGYADMRLLPFLAESFDCVLCYGTIYYGTRDDTLQAAREIHRVLKPGGHTLISMRTVHDWRLEHGETIAERTIRFRMDDQPEDGMVMNFADAADIEQLAQLFALVDVNVLEETKQQMTRRESDWLIVARKEP